MKNSEKILTSAERRLEAALSELRPIATTIDRDAIMYRAGVLSARRRCRFFQAAAALLMVALAGSFLLRQSQPVPQTRVVEKIVYRPAETFEHTAVAVQTVDSDRLQRYADYSRFRDKVVTGGLDNLPSSASMMDITSLLKTGIYGKGDKKSHLINGD